MLMKRVNLILLIFCLSAHVANAIPLESHGLNPFPNIFIKLPEHIQAGEKGVVSVEEVRKREEDVIRRYSNVPTGSYLKCSHSDDDPHDDPAANPSAFKYSHDDPSAFKYSHDDPSAFKYSHDDPAAFKYSHDDPAAFKYSHDDPAVFKYSHDDPAVFKYSHDDPAVFKYSHDDPAVFKYSHDDPAVFKYSHDDPAVFKYSHDDPAVFKYSHDDPAAFKYSHDDPAADGFIEAPQNDSDTKSCLNYSLAASKYPPASRSPHIEWNDPDFLNILYKKEKHLYEWNEKIMPYWTQEIDDYFQRDICLDLDPSDPDDECLDTFQVGSLPDAKFALIFVHGAIDYKKFLGVTDTGFGGNFNLLKNLVIRNDGVYFSPSFKLIPSEVQVMQKLISHIKAQSPYAKIAFACGSSGMVICAGIAESLEDIDVDGLIFLGGSHSPHFDVNLPFFEKKTPMIIAHASYDGWESKKMFYDKVKTTDSQYPIQFQLYHGGVHGTPIRMINWKRSLNYLFLINYLFSEKID